MPWDIIGNAGTNPATNFLGTSDNQPLIIKTNASERMFVAAGGNVGIGTTTPSAKLSVVAPGTVEISGTKLSATLLTSGNALETPVGSEQALANFGFVSGAGGGVNSVSLGVRAIRTSAGVGWPTTAIGLGMDVDNTPRAGAALFLHSNGNVGIGTTSPTGKLSVTNGDDARVKIYSNGGSVGVIDSVANGDDSIGRWLSVNPTGGNVGIGTTTPSAKLSVVPVGTVELSGTAHSKTLLTSGDALGSPVGSEQALASFGFVSGVGGNSVSLGVRAIRTSAGAGWPTTAIGLGMDVDDTPHAGATLFLHSNGNVGIGVGQPGEKLSVRGGLSVSVPSSGNTIRALTLDVESFQTINNAIGSHFLLVRDIGAAPPFGLPHFIIRGDGNVGIGTGQPAAKLDVHGDVSVTGDVILTGADCAEEFDVEKTTEAEPGTVMSLGQNGMLRQSEFAYDKRVAGVISGAGDYKPGMILDRRQSQEHRMPVALVGKVYCKVDAQYTPIKVGDLLTTSPTPGHAMKAVEPQRSFGSIIGKALKPLEGGQGLIPILIALQ